MQYIYSKQDAIKKLKEDSQYIYSKQQIEGIEEPERLTFYWKKVKKGLFGKVDWCVPEGWSEHHQKCFHWAVHTEQIRKFESKIKELEESSAHSIMISEKVEEPS